MLTIVRVVACHEQAVAHFVDLVSLQTDQSSDKPGVQRVQQLRCDLLATNPRHRGEALCTTIQTGCCMSQKSFCKVSPLVAFQRNQEQVQQLIHDLAASHA